MSYEHFMVLAKVTHLKKNTVHNKTATQNRVHLAELETKVTSSGACDVLGRPSRIKHIVQMHLKNNNVMHI